MSNKHYIQHEVYVKHPSEHHGDEFIQTFMEAYPKNCMNIRDLTADRMVALNEADLIWRLFKIYGQVQPYPFKDMFYSSIPNKYVTVHWDELLFDNERSTRPFRAYSLDLTFLHDLVKTLKTCQEQLTLSDPVLSYLYSEVKHQFATECHLAKRLDEQIETLLAIRKETIESFPSGMAVRIICYPEPTWAFSYDQSATLNPYPESILETLKDYGITTLADWITVRDTHHRNLMDELAKVVEKEQERDALTKKHRKNDMAPINTLAEDIETLLESVDQTKQIIERLDAAHSHIDQYGLPLNV